MEEAPNSGITFLTQEDYKADLLRMYEQNYHRFRREELKQALLAYLFFLDREITGEKESQYQNSVFAMQELVKTIGELSQVFEQKKREIAQIPPSE